MTAKPSYLGLLNAIAVAERQASEYLHCWAGVTTDDAVRAVVHTVALREEEHGLAFEKRIDELGFGLIDRPDPKHAERIKVASSTKLSDREKFERLGLGRPTANGSPDIFDRFFENKDLDPQTGGLLGRYIAEERDTGRKFAACYAALGAATPKGKAASGSTKKKSAKRSTAKRTTKAA